MSDVAIRFDGIKSDISFTDTDVQSDDGIQTSVIISLFTDRRVGEDRGYWGDTYEDEPMGSRLWLLGREKRSQEVVLRANEYSKEALGWMIRAGLAKSIIVDSYIEDNRLIIPIKIIKPDGTELSFKYSANWKAMS